jgi:hypothetical protein
VLAIDTANHPEHQIDNILNFCALGLTYETYEIYAYLPTTAYQSLGVESYTACRFHLSVVLLYR